MPAASRASAVEQTVDLVRKYNVPGPRYTSYPPATRFTEEVSWENLRGKIEANNQSERDRSFIFPFRSARRSAGFADAPRWSR